MNETTSHINNRDDPMIQTNSHQNKNKMKKTMKQRREERQDLWKLYDTDKHHAMQCIFDKEDNADFLDEIQEGGGVEDNHSMPSASSTTTTSKKEEPIVAIRKRGRPKLSVNTASTSLSSSPSLSKKEESMKRICLSSRRRCFTEEERERMNDTAPILPRIILAGDHDCCPHCRYPLLVMEEGVPTCTSPSCGEVVAQVLDYSPEWRFFGAEDRNANDPSRCGNPINPLLEQSSYGCRVMMGGKCSFAMRKIGQWIEWKAVPHREKALSNEFQFIQVMAQNAGIPKMLIDDAMIIHKDISSQKIFRGLNRDGIKAASIYISCRLNGYPRTSHEIAEIFHLDRVSATNGCSMAIDILNNIERSGDTKKIVASDLQATTPSSFIDRYCCKLDMSQELTMLAKFVASKVEQGSLINDNAPNSIAAGIIHFVNANCRVGINKSCISQVCHVSEVTINKCFKKLTALKDKLLPQAILDKYSERSGLSPSGSPIRESTCRGLEAAFGKSSPCKGEAAFGKYTSPATTTSSSSSSSSSTFLPTS